MLYNEYVFCKLNSISSALLWIVINGIVWWVCFCRVSSYASFVCLVNSWVSSVHVYNYADLWYHFKGLVKIFSFLFKKFSSFFFLLERCFPRLCGLQGRALPQSGVPQPTTLPPAGSLFKMHLSIISQ